MEILCLDFLAQHNIKGIEDELQSSQYVQIEHQQMVVKDILENWIRLSHNNKFHAIFATSSIPEAIDYYRLLKESMPQLKVTCLFDPNISDEDSDFKEYKRMKVALFKEQGLVEIIEDYNKKYGQDFTIPNHAKFKKDIAARLAHKEPYIRIEKEPEKQIELLIVVAQMLTGFDSKWINTLYMDKMLQYENIIQAFSRTNRLFGPDKPFGTIRYYRKPNTMEQNIEIAVKLYSGDKPIGLFVEKLEYNLNKLNSIYDDIFELFNNSGIQNFEKLPEGTSERGKFASLFKEFNSYLEAAKIQGFKWNSPSIVDMKLDENTYLILALRYKELFNGTGTGGFDDVPFEIDGYLTEIDTGVIDANYMNSRFEKYLKNLQQENIDEEQMQKTLDDLHKSFAILTQEEQKYANIFLHDVQSGNTIVEDGKTIRDYISQYLFEAKNDQIYRISDVLGLDETKLRSIMNSGVNELNINEFGRFDELKNSVDKVKAKEYFEKLEKTKIPPFKINIKIHNLLQQFITKGGFELELPKSDE